MIDVVVTSKHLRSVPGFHSKPGFCVDRSRAWFVRHGLDFRGFLRHGISASVLEATGDHMAQALAAHARREEGGYGR